MRPVLIRKRKRSEAERGQTRGRAVASAATTDEERREIWTTCATFCMHDCDFFVSVWSLARGAPRGDFQHVTLELAQHPPSHELYAAHELVPLDLLVEGLGQSVVRLASRRFTHEG